MFKYGDNHADCRPCPPEDAYAEEQIEGYRFAVSNNLDEKHFHPPAILNPVRDFKTREEHCSGYALSYFISEDKLRTQHSKLMKTARSFAIKQKYIIQSAISSKTGKITPISHSGHFDLHEYNGSDIKGSSVIHGHI